MDAEHIFSQLDDEDKREVEVVLSEAKDAASKFTRYNKLSAVCSEIICGVISSYKRAYGIVYVYTYLCLIVLAHNPFTSFFGSLFVNLIIAIPYSLIPIMSMVVVILPMRLLLYILSFRINSWEDTRHIFSDYLEKKKLEISFGEATSDFFDYEVERQAMDLFREKNKNYHGPLSRK